MIKEREEYKDKIQRLKESKDQVVNSIHMMLLEKETEEDDIKIDFESLMPGNIEAMEIRSKDLYDKHAVASFYLNHTLSRCSSTQRKVLKKYMTILKRNLEAFEKYDLNVAKLKKSLPFLEEGFEAQY